MIQRNITFYSKCFFRNHLQVLDAETTIADLQARLASAHEALEQQRATTDDIVADLYRQSQVRTNACSEKH